MPESDEQMTMRERPSGRGKRPALDERSAIDVLTRVLSRQPHPSVDLAIGDDAAILKCGRGKLVWSIDSSIEGTHFDLSWLSLEQAAARALSAALSDLSAMGAAPLAAICALGVPSGMTRSKFRAIARGQAKVAERAGCPLVGGDIAYSSRLSFTTSVLGQVSRPITRSGARPGDELWLIGALGEAAMGLWLLQQGSDLGAFGRAGRACVRAWREPPLLLSEARALVGRASSLVDVSDGLASELRHIADASRVRVCADRSLLESAASDHLRRVCESVGRSPVDTMLYGGEDYALVATGGPSVRPPTARVIGCIERGRGACLQSATGEQPLERGFDHLSR